MGNETDYVTICINQYKEAVIEVLKYSMDKKYPEGWIIIRNRRPFIEIASIKNGKKCNIHKYIKNSDMEFTLNIYKEKKQFNKKMSEFKSRVAFWKKKLLSLERKSLVSIAEIENGINIFYKLSVDTEKHRNNNFTKNCANKDYKILTLQGDLVRSRLEAMTADIFAYQKLLYKYEEAIFALPAGRNNYKKTILTDFVVYPEIFKGEPVYIEVLGLVDDPKYRNDWERRMVEYSFLGIVSGRNLVALACNSSQEVNEQTLLNVVSDLKEGIVSSKIIDLSLNLNI